LLPFPKPSLSTQISPPNISNSFLQVERHSPGERNHKTASLAHLTLYHDAAPVHLCQAVYQCQPCALVLPRQAAVQLNKGFEQPRHFFWRDPDSGVPHGKVDHLSLRVAGHLQTDLPTLWNLTALDNRLIRICFKRRSSASIVVTALSSVEETLSRFS